MDIALNPNSTVCLSDKIKELVNTCKISNIEKMLSNSFENLPEQNRTLDYIGELNSNY